MDEDGITVLATAPPLPDGPPGGPPSFPRGGARRGGRGGGPRRRFVSISMARWQGLRRHIVTIGDDACLIPTQIITLSQAVSEAIVAEREDRKMRGESPKEEGAPEATGQGAHGAPSSEGENKNEQQRERQEERIDLEEKVIGLIVDCAARLPVKTGKGLGLGFRV